MKKFPNRLNQPKSNTMLNSNFYQVFEWIYFLRWKIKTDIAETNFYVFSKTRNIHENLSP